MNGVREGYSLATGQKKGGVTVVPPHRYASSKGYLVTSVADDRLVVSDFHIVLFGPCPKDRGERAGLRAAWRHA